MTSDRLRRVVKARPFHPFQICMSNGQEHVVKHPEMVAVSPRDDTALYFHDDGAVSVLDLFLMSEIKVAPPRTAQAS